MSIQRREFLKLGASLGAGAAASSFIPAFSSCNLTGKPKSGHPVGLQLYTLRDDMPKDPAGVLTKVSNYGYNQIESYEGPKGMFWGMKNTEFKKLLTGLDLSLVSSHCKFQEDFERKAGEAGEIGMKYLLCAYLGPQKSLDDFKRYAEQFNKCGEICKKNGVRFAYHNHDYSFVPLEGSMPQDVMMQNTDKDLVDYELDMYWAVFAGQDPVKWINKYPGRFRLCHVKDRKQNAAPTDRDASVNLGAGSIDYSSILNQAAKDGMNYFIVEQEAYAGTTPLDATKANADYMKKFKWS